MILSPWNEYLWTKAVSLYAKGAGDLIAARQIFMSINTEDPLLSLNRAIMDFYLGSVDLCYDCLSQIDLLVGPLLNVARSDHGVFQSHDKALETRALGTWIMAICLALRSNFAEAMTRFLDVELMIPNHASGLKFRDMGLELEITRFDVHFNIAWCMWLLGMINESVEGLTRSIQYSRNPSHKYLFDRATQAGFHASDLIILLHRNSGLLKPLSSLARMGDLNAQIQIQQQQQPFKSSRLSEHQQLILETLTNSSSDTTLPRHETVQSRLSNHSASSSKASISSQPPPLRSLSLPFPHPQTIPLDHQQPDHHQKQQPLQQILESPVPRESFDLEGLVSLYAEDPPADHQPSKILSTSSSSSTSSTPTNFDLSVAATGIDMMSLGKLFQESPSQSYSPSTFKLPRNNKYLCAFPEFNETTSTDRTSSSTTSSSSNSLNHDPNIKSSSALSNDSSTPSPSQRSKSGVLTILNRHASHSNLRSSPSRELPRELMPRRSASLKNLKEPSRLIKFQDVHPTVAGNIGIEGPVLHYTGSTATATTTTTTTTTASSITLVNSHSHQSSLSNLSLQVGPSGMMVRPSISKEFLSSSSQSYTNTVECAEAPYIPPSTQHHHKQKQHALSDETRRAGLSSFFFRTRKSQEAASRDTAEVVQLPSFPAHSASEKRHSMDKTVTVTGVVGQARVLLSRGRSLKGTKSLDVVGGGAGGDSSVPVELRPGSPQGTRKPFQTWGFNIGGSSRAKMEVKHGG